MIDPKKVRESVDIVRLVERYLELKKVGNEYRGLCPFHSDTTPSLWVIPQKQFFHCFACEASGDCIDFVREMEGLSFKDACEKLTGTEYRPLVKPKRPSDYEKRVWRSMVPPPDAGEPEMKGTPTKVWPIKNQTGQLLGYSARYDITRDGKSEKLILQYTWGVFNPTDTPGWACRHFSAPLPLYRLDKLGVNSSQQVILVEGEKKADAGNEMLPQFCCMSWLGGANKWKYADLTPLRNHPMPVVVCGDCDDPGREAMYGLADSLLNIGCKVKIIEDPTKPKGWDIADAKADGWTPEQLLSWFKDNAKVYPTATGMPAVPSDPNHPANAPQIDVGDEPWSDAPPLQHGPARVVDEAEKRRNGAYTLGVVYRAMSQIQSRAIDWLWPGRIAKGKVSMIVGNPGLGKSQVCASLTSVVSNGGIWPVDRSPCARGSVVILSAEDDPEDTIRPRLEAAGADLDRVYILDAIRVQGEQGEQRRGFDLTLDIARLGALLHELGDAALVIIDPITAYLGDADSHKNAEVRALLAPLAEMAASQRVSVLAVSHLTKSAGMDALLRVQGSIGFAAAARAVWGVAKDKDNPSRRLFMPLKNNLGTDISGFAYSVEGVRLPESDIETSHVMWESQLVTLTADEVFGGDQQRDDERGRVTDAKDFLRSLLGDGPVMYTQVKRDCSGAGYSWRTIERAKDELSVESFKDGFKSPWYWRMP